MIQLVKLFLKKIFFIFLSLVFFAKAHADDNDVYKQLNLFGEVYERVRSEYVEKIKDKELIEAAINGMLQSLDPHSSYLDADNFDEMKVLLKTIPMMEKKPYGPSDQRWGTSKQMMDVGFQVWDQQNRMTPFSFKEKLRKGIQNN